MERKLVLLFSLLSLSWAQCPDYWTVYKGSCFRVFQNASGISQTTASTECGSRGGFLANILDSGTETLLQSMQPSTVGGSTGGGPWIGAVRTSTGATTFVWQPTNKAMQQYTDWNPGEPNNSGANENCVQFSSWRGQWNDLPCAATTSGYICQIVKPDSCPNGWTRYGASCFDYVNTGGTTISWSTAVAQCQKNGGDRLANVVDAGTDAVVNNLMFNPPFSSTPGWAAQPWIGGVRTAVPPPPIQFGWAPSNTTTGNYTNWCPGEPNNSGGTENCVQTQGSCWNDYTCTILAGGYICEALKRVDCAGDPLAGITNVQPIQTPYAQSASSIVLLTCALGYQLGAEDTVLQTVCTLSSGRYTWVPCGSCPVITNYCSSTLQYVSGTATGKIGDTVIGTCPAGYVSTAGGYTVTYTCIASTATSGTWTTSQSCTIITTYCDATPVPEADANAVAPVSGSFSRTINSQVTLSCNLGYAVSSGVYSEVAKCVSSTPSAGVWSTAPDSCQLITTYCDTNPAGPVTLASAPTDFSLTVGTVVQLSCPSGYTATTSPLTSTCTAHTASSGFWSANGSCQCNESTV